MTTIVAIIIDGKYDKDFEGLYWGTIILDAIFFLGLFS